MAGVTCGPYIFGSDEGIITYSYTKDIRWKVVGHFESGGRWTLDCNLVESAEVTHNLTTYGVIPSEPTKIFSSSTMYLAETSVQASKETMWQWTWVYKEFVTTGQCSVTIPEMSFTPTVCAWGLLAGNLYPTQMNYRRHIELSTIPGPTGMDGSDFDKPISGIAVAIPYKIVENLQVTTDKKMEGDPTSETIESAFNNATVTLEGAKKWVSAEQHNEPYNDIQTWSYTMESQTTYG
jgi:hypothetical protein